MTRVAQMPHKVQMTSAEQMTHEGPNDTHSNFIRGMIFYD